jgi:DNA-binding transcriptional LysR family regulator
VGRTLEPTPRAVALAPDRAQARVSVRALAEPPEAAPARTWHVAASDYGFVAVVLPWLARAEPGAMEVHRIGAETVGALDRGELHLAVAPRADVRGVEGLVVTPLFRDAHAVVMREGHPLTRGKLTLARYLAARHVAVRTDAAGRSVVEEALRREGHARSVAWRVPSLSLAMQVVRRTDAIATVPVRFARGEGLVVRPAPFAVPELEIALAFAPRYTLDAAHRALREELKAASA